MGTRISYLNFVIIISKIVGIEYNIQRVKIRAEVRKDKADDRSKEGGVGVREELFFGEELRNNPIALIYICLCQRL